MKPEHKNGRTDSAFEARMLIKREREAKEEAQRSQERVPVSVVQINGIKVSHGELPQVAHQLRAKRVCRLIAYFDKEGQETSENWRQIYRQVANCSAYPDCMFFVFHIPITAGMNPKMDGNMHKEKPDTLTCMADVLFAIADGDSSLIPVVQGSKHWCLPGRGMVELNMTWL